jgi:hypothetical protein
MAQAVTDIYLRSGLGSEATNEQPHAEERSDKLDGMAHS